MRPLMPLCLSMLCLLLSTTPVTKAGLNISTTIASITSKAPNHTALVSTDATEGPSSSTFHTSNVPVKTQPKTEHMSTYAETTRGQTSKTTKENENTSEKSKQSSGGTVVVVLFILVLIILLVIALRWYKQNPDRRSCRGLRDSIVETAQLAWSTVMGCLQRPQKRAEGIEEDEEVVEMEAGGGEETMEEGPKEEGAKQEEDDDSDSDSSLEEYSIVDAANLTEGEKQEGEEEDRKSAKEEGGETEEMTSVTLEDEEKAEPEEVDDLTPL